MVLGAGLVAYRAWRAWQSRGQTQGLPLQSQAGVAVVLWLLMPLVFFVVHVSPVYPHYLTILFALSFALSGVFLDGLLSRC